MSAAQAKGTKWESEIVRYLRESGVPHAERRAPNGTNDRGDIAGIPGVVIEAKSEKALRLAEWVREAEAECANDNAAFGIVWAKRLGRSSPADGYAVMTGATLVALLQAAGYITPPATAAPEAPDGSPLPDTLTTPRSAGSGDPGPVPEGLLRELQALVARHAVGDRASATVVRPVDLHWGIR